MAGIFSEFLTGLGGGAGLPSPLGFGPTLPTKAEGFGDFIAGS
jgi:hypothetical protein